MYSIITILSGVLLAVMVVVNGELSAQYGVFGSSVIVQVVGTLFALAMIVIKREKMVLKTTFSKWYYLSGIVTAAITVLQNAAFHYISMTSIIALGLIGQTIISLLIDQFGLFGMKKTAPSKSLIVSLIFAGIGIIVMADGTVANSVFAIILSLAAGVAIVLSRVFNAKIAEGTSILQGSFISYFLGLPAVIFVAWLMGEMSFRPVINMSNIGLYFGGILGVGIVLICNFTTLRVSAFKLSILIFAGQVLTGIIIDLIFNSFTMDASFWGGIIISAGILISKLWDR